MKNTRLIKILKTFSKEEFREFEKFTASPYFSRGRNLSPFLNTLKKFYPTFESEEFTGENVFSKLFPGKQFNEKTSRGIINIYSHELIKMCEEFLAISGAKEDVNSRNYFLLKKLFQKKLHSEFERIYKDASDFQKKNQDGNPSALIDKYFLLEIFCEYSLEKNEYKKVFESLASQDEVAAVFGLIRAYRGFENKHLAPFSFNIESIPNFSGDLIDNLDSVKLLDEIKNRRSEYYPYLIINYWFYLIGEQPDNVEYYFEFKKKVYENLHLFGHTEKYRLLSRLHSYSAKRFYQFAERKFLAEEFEIYCRMLELGVYKWSVRDDFSIHLFRDIILTALDLNELDWLENFANKYSAELAPDDRDNMKYYALANLNYSRKEFEKALENIQKIKINFAHYKLDLKNLMFKIYYDLNSIEPALSVLESMRQYISTGKEVTPTGKIKTGSFIKIAKELLKIKSGSVKINAGYLINKIEKDKNVGSQKWLLEKAKGLQ